MEIPKRIENKMRKALKLYTEAHQLMKDIEDYIEKNYKGDYNEDEPWRRDNGCSLTEIECAENLNAVDVFLEFAKNDFKD